MASVLTLIVVGVAGYGTIVILRENTGSNIASDTQYNLNRAADFIADEIKGSSNIVANASLSTFITTNCSGSGNEVGTGTITPILGLAVNGSSTTNTVYYMQKPSATWLGNNAIYRCGPELSSDGSYADPVNIKSRLLVDLISSNRSPNDPVLDNTPPGSCSSGYTAHPANTDTGFFVCVNGLLAEIHLASSALELQGNQTTQWISTNSNSRFNDKATYGVVTQAFARAPGGQTITVAPASGVSASASPVTPLVFTFNRFGSTSSAATINFTVSGSALFTTQYTQTGAATFNVTNGTSTGTGTITIPANSSTANLTITPVNAGTLPAGVIISIGSNSVTGTINP